MCERPLRGIWRRVSRWVMLRDSAVEDGASRHEKQNDTCEISRGHWQTVIRWGLGRCVGLNLSQHKIDGNTTREPI